MRCAQYATAAVCVPACAADVRTYVVLLHLIHFRTCLLTVVLLFWSEVCMFTACMYVCTEFKDKRSPGLATLCGFV